MADQNTRPKIGGLSGDEVIRITDEDGLAYTTTVKEVLGMLNKQYQVLTSAVNVAMNTKVSSNAKITLAHNATLTLTNLQDGIEGNIIVIQGSSNFTLNIIPYPAVINDGQGAIALQDGPGAITILSYTYDGVNLYITYGLNYTKAS